VRPPSPASATRAGCLRAGYDDGGFSGATIDRPALQRLLADITAGRVDTIVVYKIDRLTRSLADFAKIGAEASFDFERQLFSLASREMSFGQPFFGRVARDARHPGEPASDGSEYDEEEAKQALWKKLSATQRSRFLNMAADNHVTWPSEPTLVKFDGYHFVLMPRIKDHVQSVHMDLTEHRLDDSSANAGKHAGSQPARPA
jgi:hypothetical protein